MWIKTSQKNGQSDKNENESVTEQSESKKHPANKMSERTSHKGGKQRRRKKRKRKKRKLRKTSFRKGKKIRKYSNGSPCLYTVRHGVEEEQGMEGKMVGKPTWVEKTPFEFKELCIILQSGSGTFSFRHKRLTFVCKLMRKLACCYKYANARDRGGNRG